MKNLNISPIMKKKEEDFLAQSSTVTSYGESPAEQVKAENNGAGNTQVLELQKNAPNASKIGVRDLGVPAILTMDSIDALSGDLSRTRQMTLRLPEAYYKYFEHQALMLQIDTGKKTTAQDIIYPILRAHLDQQREEFKRDNPGA